MKKIALFALLVLVLAGTASAQEVWFSPWAKTADFSKLFAPDAPWGRVASSVALFEIDSSVVLRGDLLPSVISDLTLRKIPLGVGIAPLSGGPNGCGYHVEGYSARGEPASVAAKLKLAGALPNDFAFDEPLHFGHTYEGRSGSTGCRYSVADVAKDVATKVQEIKKIFPAARFGDVEPYRNDDGWIGEVGQWIDAFRAATGSDLSFFRLDIAWHMQWKDKIPALVAMLRAKRVPLQVIYNGNDNLRSDDAWVRSAEDNFKAFQAVAHPSVVVFQYWLQHPSRLLPESDPNTATGLVIRYLEWQRKGG